MKERIDKILATNKNVARSEVKKLIKNGAVAINGVVVKDGGEKCDPEIDIVEVYGKKLNAEKYIYIMLNKPVGTVSATEDGRFPTVVDILPDNLKRRGLFPAGRLDKDTTGFCLITDDGDFAHKILSPVSHVEKTYTAEIDKTIDFEKAKEAFFKGIVLADKTVLLSAVLERDGTAENRYIVTIKEGKYHQIKRMFASLGAKVTALRRDAIGGLLLDKTLKPGEARLITKAELTAITGGKPPVG